MLEKYLEVMEKVSAMMPISYFIYTDAGIYDKDLNFHLYNTEDAPDNIEIQFPIKKGGLTDFPFVLFKPANSTPDISNKTIKRIDQKENSSIKSSGFSKFQIEKIRVLLQHLRFEFDIISVKDYIDTSSRELCPVMLSFQELGTSLPREHIGVKLYNTE